MRREAGFFDVEERLRELSAKGDALERLSAVVDFELFRADLERAVPRSDGSKGGRTAFDYVLMFKVLVLQASHSLSDERTEYLIRDRLSFMRFLGLRLADTVPDSNTIWTFREALTRAKLQGKPAVEVVFKRFDGGALGGRVAGDGRADHRRHDRRRTEAAQHRWREARNQGRPHPGGVGEEAGQAAAEGPRRTLDGQIHQRQCRPSSILAMSAVATTAPIPDTAAKRRLASFSRQIVTRRVSSVLIRPSRSRNRGRQGHCLR
jgi:hypothetical protein